MTDEPPAPPRFKLEMKVSLGQLLTVAGLLVYGVIAQQYCKVEIDRCYQGWNNCTVARFPFFNASLLSTNATTINGTIIFPQTPPK
jgi:hypothetical protein